MKINFYLPPEDPVRKELTKLGIENDPGSEYVILKRVKDTAYLPARRNDTTYYLDVKNLIYAESMGHDVFLHMQDGVYNSSDRLKQLEKILDSSRFLRISNSCIVNLRAIKRIESSLLQKFVLHLADGSRVEVTRTYYYIFKDRLGI